MKFCPFCKTKYPDEGLNFCRLDGRPLIELETAPTRVLGVTGRIVPKTEYARSGEINIAYQVLGNGPVDLIYVPGWVSHLEYGWEEPSLARFYWRLASFSRLILFDKRGTGLSDRSTELPTLEERMDDVRAVMQAVGSARAVIFGMSEGGNMAILFAATYPEHTIGLITFGVFAKRICAPEYPWAPTPEQRQEFYEAIKREWGGPMGLEELAPSKAQDEQFRQWWATYQRRSATPGAALDLARMNTGIDVRQVLPAIRVPSLVMHRAEDRDAHVEEGRYIAAQIPNATFVELPGADHLLFVGDQESVLSKVEDFIKAVGQTTRSDSVLATILYVMTAGENKKEDKGFAALVQRETDWFKGRLSEANGDSTCATFDGPIRAIRCAKAIRDAAVALGIETRTGLHTGLCEMQSNQASGETVEIARQIATRAEPGEVLLTNTVMDLVSGSGFEFSPRGDCQLDGLSQDCRLFSVSR